METSNRHHHDAHAHDMPTTSPSASPAPPPDGSTDDVHRSSERIHSHAGQQDNAQPDPAGSHHHPTDEKLDLPRDIGAKREMRRPDDEEQHDHDDAPHSKHQVDAVDHGDHDHHHATDDEVHGHDHGHAHEHGHAHGGLRMVLSSLLPFGHGHSHDIGDTAADQALGGTEEGLRTVKLSLVGLGVTAAIQVVIAILSGSVGLLADTIHNGADALTAIPLWIAFTLGRRAPTRRYSYGYGRAEDAAGLAVVAIIFISAMVAAWESLQKLLHPRPMDHLGLIALGAVVGFIGNEVVAHLRISTGERIGSAALVADGQHARADGITSLSVLFAVLGSWLGFPLADPIIGLLITIAILAIGKNASVLMWHRLMDAVDPDILDIALEAATAVPGVKRVNTVRARWIGHRMLADLLVEVDATLTVTQGHDIAEKVRHALLHRLPRLDDVVVHIDPERIGGRDPHALTAHHTASGR